MLHSVKLCLHTSLCAFIMFSFSDVMNNLKFLLGFSITTFHDSFALSSFYNVMRAVIILSVILAIIFIALCIISVCKAIFIGLSIGKPPFGRLTIAYKFTEAGVSQTEGIINRTRRMFPGKKFIRINYSDSKTEEMGIAFGAVLSEGGSDPSDDLRLFLFNNDYRLFFIPAVNHAVFAVCPIISWFALSYWIAIVRLYPKMFKFCEKRNLSAYPVVEVLDKETLTIVVPLAQQNDYVVFEAEDMINRSNLNCSLDSSLSSSFSSSLPIEQKVSCTKSLGSAPIVRKIHKKKAKSLLGT
ncbi:hypothetical protein LSTR_LSTR010253 [Laodelphax striatellus]|uniref:Uncharacterized protein n=1 Tax=Laodelphax striatellus TaxID=195883 RepID=A0A482WL85_LAOST|nr:hypothetical protein LSTR_LSTR010253 [Laodelphax striatellus]